MADPITLESLMDRIQTYAAWAGRASPLGNETFKSLRADIAALIAERDAMREALQRYVDQDDEADRIAGSPMLSSTHLYRTAVTALKPAGASHG